MSNYNIHCIHYVLCFIDNQFKVCDTLDEAFCYESVRGKNEDEFLKKNGKSYQFALYDDNCCIKLLNDNHSFLVEEKFWMRPYLRDYLHIIYNSKQPMKKKFIIEEEISNKKQIKFYIREININIKLELYEKIVCKPSEYTKKYTSSELFQICYSYAFSFLDNQFFILKNILFLIVQESFDLEDINQKFLDFFIQKNKNSEFLHEFFQMQYSENTKDLQSKFDQFLKNHDFSKSNNDFLYYLNHWKCTITNLFFLIQQTFCLQIVSEKNNFIIEIYNNRKQSSFYRVTFNNFKIIMPFVHKNCIFSLESFTDEGNYIISQIHKYLEIDKIQIDFTEFIKKFHNYEEIEIIRESIKFCDFIEKFLIQTIKKPIFLNFGIYQFKIMKNPKTGLWKLFTLQDEDQFYFDAILSIIMKKICVLKPDKIVNPLKNIVQSIYGNFCKYNENNIYKYEKITFNFYEDALQSLKKFNIYDGVIYFDQFKNEFSTKNTNFNPYKLIGENYLTAHNFNRFGTYSNRKNDKSKIYSSPIIFETSHLLINNEMFSNGLLDENFSFFLPDQSSNQSKFLSKIKTILNNKHIENYDRKFINQKYSDIFDRSNNEQNSIFIKIHLINTNNSIHLNSKFSSASQFENSYFPAINAETSDLRPKNMIIEIYHYEKQYVRLVKCNHIQHLNLQKFLIERTECILDNFVVKYINFHYIFEQLLELKSIDMRLSSMHKQTNYQISQVHIYYCIVSFLSYSYLKMDVLHLYNCIFESTLDIHDNIFSKPMQQFYISNFELKKSKTINLFNFAVIRPIDTENLFALDKKKFEFIIHLENCEINFMNEVPYNISQIKLYKCEINAKNNVLHSSENITKNTVQKINFVLNTTEKNLQSIRYENERSLQINSSKLPDYLQIYGFFNSITIYDCFFSFDIGLFTNFYLMIHNHRGKFSIQNHIINASPLQNDNILEKCRRILCIKNFELETLQNYKINELILENCSIKIIQNIECKKLVIINTKCAFQRITQGNIYSFSGNSINISISEKKYMILEKYSIQNDIREPTDYLADNITN